MKRGFRILACWRCVSLIMTLAVTGCSLAAFVNAAGLRRDMTWLLQQHGVKASRLACSAEAATRDGRCAFDASASDVAKLTEGLSLADVTEAKRYSSREAYFQAQFDRVDQMTQEEAQRAEHEPVPAYAALFSAHKWFSAGCFAMPEFQDRDPLVIYGAPRRIPLADGTAWSFLVLFYNPSALRACADISYAYG